MPVSKKKKSSKREPTNIRLDDTLKRRLQKVARKNYITVSDIIRQAILKCLPDWEENDRKNRRK